MELINMNIGCFKLKLKIFLLGIQSEYDYDEWLPMNFSLEQHFDTLTINRKCSALQ